MRKLLAAVAAVAVLTPLASCDLPEGSGPAAPVVEDGSGSHAGKRPSRTPSRPRAPAAKPKRPSHAPSTPRPSPTVGRVGTPIRSGGLTFTVTRVRNRVRRIGTLLGKKPKGRYTLVYLTVTNSGKELRIFDAGEQRLVAWGRRYKPDFSAAAHLHDTESFMQPVDPGHTIRAVLAFDVPKTVFHPSAVMLRASVFSTWVTVRLN